MTNKSSKTEGAADGFQTIDLKIAKGTQSLVYTELGVLCGAKVKVEVKSDSYSQQSYAQLHAWSGGELKWNVVTSIHYALMKTESGLYSRPEFQRGQPGAGDASLFLADRNELIRLARAILG